MKALGLSHLTGSLCHPNRSQNSPWIEVRFNSAGEVDKLSSLVRLAVAEL